MKNLLGNSCAKGCLVYVAGLFALIVFTTLGLSGLKGKFGVNTVGTPVTVQTQTQSQPDLRTQVVPNPAATVAQNNSAVPTPVPQSTDQSQQTVPPPVTQSDSTQSQSIQAQGGVISGGSISPFYIVQEGDTLWSIAERFGVAIDALRTLNNVLSDIIQPGQLLYLPGADVAQPTSVPSGDVPPPVNSSATPGNSTSDVPTMPHTGIGGNP